MKLSELADAHHELMARNVEAEVVVEVEGVARVPVKVREVREGGKTKVVLVVPARRVRASRARVVVDQVTVKVEGGEDGSTAASE